MKIESEDYKTNESENSYLRKSNGGNIILGLIIIIAGAIFLLRNTGVKLPDWLFTWPMLLIVIGLISGARHSYKSGGWWILCLVGLVFLFKDSINGLAISNIVWPIILIFFGLIIMLKPRRACNMKNNRYRGFKNCGCDSAYNYDRNDTNEDIVESTTIFGGVKKNIISKNFKGGEIVCVFGGTEINLINADIEEKAILDITQIFGGTQLIIPSNWNVKSEMTAILGGIEDKRDINISSIESNKKTLIIRGTSIFAGIDIKN